MIYTKIAMLFVLNVDTLAVFEHCWNKELCVLDCFPRELLPSCLAYFGKVKPDFGLKQFKNYKLVEQLKLKK